MIKINGIKASILNDETEKFNSTPSINEILDRMENNFVARNSNQKVEKLDDVNSQNIFQNNSNFFDNKNIFGENNLMFDLLPLLLTSKTKKIDSSVLIKHILKKSSNPMLQKIVDILPKIAESQKSKDDENEKKEVKIDSFVRTNDTESEEYEKDK